MENKEDNQPGKATVGYSGPEHGMQGVDQPPGKETPSSTENIIREAQKGKNKVDGDLSKESDQPMDPL
ncbi:MAG: hypothetical protein JWR72_2782 [Flavisolibacter sp.]|jgi:hypothetical protein|nr:hypothetical protein [Flavisolibacter sp.]